MAKKTIEEVDEVLDAIDPVESTESPEKAKFRQIIEEYKVQNPVKYEMKKEALEAKLNSL